MTASSTKKRGAPVKSTGKICTRCGQYKDYLNPDGSTNFHRTGRGYRQPCKACRKGEVYLGGGKMCQYCGADLEEKTSQVACHECTIKVRKWQKGSVYICVHDPTDGRPWLDGHLKWSEMHYMPNGTGEIDGMLPMGYCPEGMELELWKDREFVGLFEVVGPQLEPQHLIEITPDEYQPVGDRRFFT